MKDNKKVILWIFLALMGMLALRECDPLSSMCGNDIIQERMDRSHLYKAVTYVRDCGATTTSVTCVTILKAPEELSNKSESIFIAGNTRVSTEWKQSGTFWNCADTLLITVSDLSQVVKVKNKFRHVTIVCQQE